MQTSTSKNKTKSKKTTTKLRESQTVRRAREALALALEQDKRNKAFSKLTVAEKRVAIAKDALLQIKMERFVPTTGVYVLPEGSESVSANTPVCELVSGNCEVCAKGALFVAAIDLKNGVKLKDVMGDDNVYDGEADISEIASDGIVSYLDGIFTQEQLDLMEAAFEHHDISALLGKDVAAKLGCNPRNDYEFAFMPTEDNAEERLVAILENVIKNKGQFVLTKKDVGHKDSW